MKEGSGSEEESQSQRTSKGERTKEEDVPLQQLFCHDALKKKKLFFELNTLML